MDERPEASALAADEVRRRLERALRDVLDSHAGADNPFESDLRLFLALFDEVGEPRLFHVGERPARYLAPLKTGGKVGALVACDPFTGEVLAWPGWLPGPKPPYLLTEEALLGLVAANDPRVGEVVPATLDRANRFAVTPELLQKARMIDGWDRLPFKNQEERWSWVEHVRSAGRMRTEWRYSPGVQYPAYKCLSYASSTVADWWGWMYGKPPVGRYQNMVNGLQEYGLNPRELEVLYHHRAERDPVHYARLPPAEKTLDPVTRERIPTSLRGYARLLASPADEELVDPLYRDGGPVYTYSPGKYHMDGPPRVLFTRNRHDELAIVDALESHGVVLGMTQKRLFGVVPIGLHAIPIVGYIEGEGEITFVYHESYGNKAAGYLWDNSGGPGLMSIPARLLRGAVVFPHRLWLDVEGGAVVARHSGGGKVEVELRASAHKKPLQLSPDASGAMPLPDLQPGPVEIEFLRRHWNAPDGGPFATVLKWPGSVRGAPLAITRWDTLVSQRDLLRPTPVPLWLSEALEQCEREVAHWVERTGRAEAHRRLEPLRELFLAGAGRVHRKRLVDAFPALAGR
ncbi:MAG: hypothetical protein HY303_01395 [Candidatus Wallbacteria bacterium]|nr:hypothetical protein [Candidatus Wallbacteria bacterium]